MAAGGNWDLWCGSFWSAYRPRPAGTPPEVNALEGLFNDAETAWERGGRRSRSMPPWPIERRSVKFYRRKQSET
jgi:hypothetical protein